MAIITYDELMAKFPTEVARFSAFDTFESPPKGLPMKDIGRCWYVVDNSTVVPVVGEYVLRFSYLHEDGESAVEENVSSPSWIEIMKVFDAMLELTGDFHIYLEGLQIVQDDSSEGLPIYEIIAGS